MSKAEGRLIGIGFNLPVNQLLLTPTIVVDESYTCPSGTVTCSNQYSTAYSADKAFDDSTSTYWQTRTTLPQWNMIELPESKSVAGFRMYSGSSYRPNAVDLYGSKDGVNFDLITQTVNANSTGWKEHTFDVTDEYKYYKWVVGSTHTSGRVYIYELALLFTETVNRSGNENAFTVSSQEFLFTDGPNHNGELVNTQYSVKTVQTHPTEPNAIQLIMNDYIRNSKGLVTVNYNQALGNLAGAGGAVASFIETFTPIDLEEGLSRTGGAYGMHEYVTANATATVSFAKITKLSGYVPSEYVAVSANATVQLIHISDINP
jgi:hypothetical protein